jgi:hypothetical protein
VANELEAFVIEQMFDVAAGAGEKIIEANDIGALCQKALAQMRTEEAGAAGHQNTLL